MKNFLSASVLGLGLATTAQAQDVQDAVVGEKYVFENCSAPEGKGVLTMGDVAGVTTQLNAKLIGASTVPDEWYRSMERDSIAVQRREHASFVQTTRALIDQFVAKLDAVPAKNDAETSAMLESLNAEINRMFIEYEKSPYVIGSPSLPERKEMITTKVKGDLPTILRALDVECKGMDGLVTEWLNPVTQDSNAWSDYSPRPYVRRPMLLSSVYDAPPKKSALEQFQSARNTVEKFRVRITQTESVYSGKLDELASIIDPKVEEPVPPPKGKKKNGK